MNETEKGTAVEAPKPQANEEATAKPKRSRRGLVVGGVVAAVVVVAGIGAFAWHEQPSFCNAICHSPMDGYLETYEATPGEAATDKWGNEVANASGMLSAVHRTNDSNATCLSCHQPVMSEQLTEAGSWVSGSYTMLATESNTSGELVERDSEDLTAASGSSADSFCLRSGCHVNDDGSVMTRDDLTALTAKESDDPSVTIRNPHSWQHGQQACTTCHKAHRASVLTCTECHSDMEVPEGWITAQESKTLTNQATSAE